MGQAQIAAMDCAQPGTLATSSSAKPNAKGKFSVEIAASVLFGIPPLANAYHTSIVVEGEEYFFSDQGMCFDDKLISHAGKAHERYEAGRTDYSGTEMWWALQAHFRPGTYDLLRKNCNSFSDAALFFLLRERLDKKYAALETLGRTSPDVVMKVIYVPNPVADSFDIENVIDAISKLGTGKRISEMCRSMQSVPSQAHRIPHLPRESISRKAMGDITNEPQGPGARANALEATAQKTVSRVQDARPAPRKFASTQMSRQLLTPPRPTSDSPPTSMGPPAQPQASKATPTWDRGQNPDRFLTNRVYPTNPVKENCKADKENLSPGGKLDTCFGTREVLENEKLRTSALDRLGMRSRSKGPTDRNGSSITKSVSLSRALAALGGA